MADLSPSAVAMNLYSDSVIGIVQGGEAIAAGQIVYKKSADNKYYKADADALESAQCAGIAIMPCPAASDYFAILRRGGIDLGCTLTVGETYFVSGTAGGLQPSADVGAGEYVTKVGIAITAAKLEVDIHVSGIAHG